MRLFNFNNIAIRYRLIIACTLLFAPLSIMVGLFSDSLMKQTLETQIRRELKNSTDSILNMIKLSAHLSIKNSLRNIAEKNADIVRMHYTDFVAGKITEEEAKRRSADVLLSQQIASSGYIYCLDSSGVVVVHPVDTIVGQDLSDISFVADQIQRKSGYVEYAWKNPDDPMAQPKAVWMTYFEPWDWIISVSAYRNEFRDVVNIDDFRESIGSLEFMKNGYSFVLDTQGNLIAHPTYQGKNVYAQGVETPEGLFSTMLTNDMGEVSYHWQNPTEFEPREKILVFNRIEEMGWIVASSAYIDDLYRPLHTIRSIGLLVGLFIFSGGVLIAMQISTTITNPLATLIDHLALGARGDYSARMSYNGRDEIGQLSSFFNHFMERLGDANREREKLEAQLIEGDDKQRLRAGQDLHDDLAPHLIGVEILCNTLTQRLHKEASPSTGQAETISTLVAKATEKTRAIARGFCPIHRVDEGLHFALKELADSVRTFHGIECHIQGIDTEPLERNIAVHIYRITQEAISNAVKHARPESITVILSQEEETFSVTICDNGSGQFTKSGSSGMGQKIMECRARMIGGTVTTQSSPNIGTTVRLELPHPKTRTGDYAHA